MVEIKKITEKMEKKKKTKEIPKENKKWFARWLDKLEKTHPQPVATIKFLYGIK